MMNPGKLVFSAVCIAGLCALVCAHAEGPIKKVLMIIAADGFRDEELLQPKAVLENSGMNVTVASSTSGIARGMLGAQVRPDVCIDAVRAADYDAVVFVGGTGAQEYWDDPAAHTLARQAAGDGKIVAAICIGPVTLARAGLLKNKNATVWGSEQNELKAGGARYTARPVERDGLIITASGPAAAEEFGQALVNALKE